MQNEIHSRDVGVTPSVPYFAACLEELEGNATAPASDVEDDR